MQRQQHNYHILGPQDMSPRDEIVLVPEDQLDPFLRAELNNLRRGVPYLITIGDTVENRNNFNQKAMYFQMVAYKEGWEFNPENLQVKFIPSSDPQFPKDGSEYRVMCFDEEANGTVDFGLEYKISEKGRIGIRVPKNGDQVSQLRPEEADDIGSKVINLFEWRSRY